jgi:hypothetical protein
LHCQRETIETNGRHGKGSVVIKIMNNILSTHP